MSVLHGQPQRLVAQRRSRETLVGRRPIVDLSAHLQQQLGQLDVAVLGGQMQRTVAAVVDRIDVGATDQQQSHRLVVLLPDGIVQGTQTLGHRLVHLLVCASELGGSGAIAMCV